MPDWPKRTRPRSISRLTTAAAKAVTRFARWGNTGLARHQDGLVSALAVVVAGAFLFVFICLLCITLAGVVGDSSPGPFLDRRDIEHPAPVYRDAGSETSGSSDDDRQRRTPLPGVDWNDPALRRRGMSLLCLSGAHGDAFKLLRATDADREELLLVTESRNQSVLEALERYLRDEATAGTTPDTPLADRLRRQGESLPDESLFRYVVNLHCKLREQTGASDPHLKLLLESCFPPGSATRSIYVNSQRLVPLPPATPPLESRE